MSRKLSHKRNEICVFGKEKKKRKKKVESVYFTWMTSIWRLKILWLKNDVHAYTNFENTWALRIMDRVLFRFTFSMTYFLPIFFIPKMAHRKNNVAFFIFLFIFFCDCSNEFVTGIILIIMYFYHILQCIRHEDFYFHRVTGTRNSS